MSSPRSAAKRRSFVAAALLCVVRALAGPAPAAQGKEATKETTTPEAAVAFRSVPLTFRSARFTTAELARPEARDKSEADDETEGRDRTDGVSRNAPAWTLAAHDDRAWTPTVFNEWTARMGLGPWIPAPKVPITPPPSPGVIMAVPFAQGQVLHVRAVFDAPEAATFRQLEIRCAYADGVVVWLNGREVARRGTGTVGNDGARAPFSHGPDPEAFYVPLPRKLLGERDNVLAVEVWPGPGARSAVPRSPALDQLTATATTGVRIVRGPYWTRPLDDSATLRWETDLPSTGDLSVKKGTRTEHHATPLGTKHAVLVKHLGHQPGVVTYTVKARSKDAGETETAPAAAPIFPAAPRLADARSSHHGAPPAPVSPLSFVVYGDMRAPGHAAHAKVVAAVVAENPALVLNTGDLVLIGSEEGTWQRYFDITRALGSVAAVVPTLGNHDTARAGQGARKTWDLFGLPPPAPPPPRASPTRETYTFSFDLGGVHFVLLDTNRVDDAQRAWLADDLARARRHKARAIFAFGHAGPFTHGVHGGDSSVARALAPTLAAAHVDMLFSGHDHIYERGEGPTSAGPLPYIVTGGGGAPLYEPSCQPVAHAAPPTAKLPPAPNRDPARDVDVPPSEAVPSPSGADKGPCPPWVAALEKSYHYITVTVGEQSVRYCPKTPDGTPLEPCVERAVSSVAPSTRRPSSR